MSNDNPGNLPVDPRNSQARSSQGRALYIEQLHYHANDLSELRRLAETDPVLAAKVVDGRQEAIRLAEGSFRLGIIATSILATVGLAGAIYIVVNIGWWQTAVFVLAMLGASHMARSVLTGEWSDTSWIGRLLGGKSSDK